MCYSSAALDRTVPGKPWFEAEARVAVIDQRIVIQAPVGLVWLYLTEPAHVSRWHRAAKQLLVLTTRPGGVGARRRIVDARGRGVVEEITAWMEPYGYEYRVVDGPYRSFTGRLRLQAVVEGTQVNWTIDYQMRGAFGGLGDRLGGRRALRRQMAESLRALRRLIEASGVRFTPAQILRLALPYYPGCEAGLIHPQEKTRQGGSLSSLPTPLTAGAAPTPSVSMPALSAIDDDLADLPPAEAIPTFTAPFAVPTIAPASAGLNQPVLEDDTKPRPPAGLHAALATIAPARNMPQYRSATVSPPPAASSTSTVPAALVAPHPHDPTTQTGVLFPASPAPSMPLPASSGAAEQAEKRPPLDARDTGEMSIWDVFGLDKPEQHHKADLDAVIADLQTPLPQPAFRRTAERSGNVPEGAKADNRDGVLSAPQMPPVSRASTPAQPPVEQYAFAPGQTPKPSAHTSQSTAKARISVRRVNAPQHARAVVSVRSARLR